MSTVIICPACNTRFETAAVIPPEGRKVRCSKCGNVWQATAVVEAAKPAGVLGADGPRPPRAGTVAPAALPRHRAPRARRVRAPHPSGAARAASEPAEWRQPRRSTVSNGPRRSRTSGLASE